MRNLIIFSFFIIFSNYTLGANLMSVKYVEKVAEDFVLKMNKGANKPSDVVNFMKNLKRQKKYDVSTFIETLKYIDYTKFNKNKCLQYKKTLIARASNPSVELNDENIDTDLYYGLQILAKVCKNPSISNIKL